MADIHMVRQKAQTLARILREDPVQLLKIIRGNFSVYIVHAREISAVPEPTQIEGLEFRYIPADVLSTLAARYPELQYQEEARRLCGVSAAYGVYKSGELASICWLMTEELDGKLKTRLVGLRKAEVEITRAYTFPDYRGQGLYSVAIRNVCEVGRALGAERVFMITNWRNAASRRGIERAGLRRKGILIMLEPPVIGTMIRPVFRFFRLATM
jgi:GNAT superfamily N-acetyltransferase